jgi:hypothetical protein
METPRYLRLQMFALLSNVSSQPEPKAEREGIHFSHHAAHLAEDETPSSWIEAFERSSNRSVKGTASAVPQKTSKVSGFSR